MKKILLALSIAVLSTQTFALFCPNGFNQINMGDTIDQVTQQCGIPDFKKTTKEKPFVPQIWTYYVNPNPTQSSTVQMQITFNAEKKSINIAVMSQSLGATSLCSGNTNAMNIKVGTNAPNNNNIQVGDNADAIKKACGDPAMITKTQQQNTNANADKEIEITEFKYNTAPPTLLIFTDGKLTQRDHL